MNQYNQYNSHVLFQLKFVKKCAVTNAFIRVKNKNVSF